jgi:hypothetical protein
VHLHALVVVVDGDRERPLGGVLADDVLVEDLVDLPRLGQRVELEGRRRRQLLVDDLIAEIDALVADVDAGAGDQLLDLTLGLPAEAAEELLVRVGWTCQGFFPFASGDGSGPCGLGYGNHRAGPPASLLGRSVRPFKGRPIAGRTEAESGGARSRKRRRSGLRP